ncbi:MULTISPECIES: family 10 glycosylhydrolase [Limnospira]|uniref:family 10 glycosylhydrolase n=1 Tax=Limnospira TaxID=2596745 RepID=UPI00028045D4|nr:hypothetical protein SPLC1_S550450 [Arthrospira platensis C1]QJB26934.1 family 10 glycosylhydrolase [Limnospira fusiformis SAG 85.79]UWU49156.1 Uncharacterized lipoprotein YddW, UPF0748 family [Arthrospira platensis C1]
MSNQKREPGGCGCASIPFSVILLFLGGGYWLFTQRDNLEISRFFNHEIIADIPFLNTWATSTDKSPPTLPNIPEIPQTTNPEPKPQSQPQPEAQPETPPKSPTIKPPSPIPSSPLNTWEGKPIRGIYLSRYQATNNASEETIRARVRYYRDRGINTIIHGVWGNACTMYESQVMQAKFGYSSCQNLFEEEWIDWLIDEAHKHGMEVHAYFEKGIKIDENSHAFDWAVQRGWIVPGVDRTHPGVDHYVLNVGIPEVAQFFTDIVVEFVQKYPTIDAVQWDDYLGYHDELPGQIDRTPKLTNFVRNMIAQMKAANPSVSFDICHHNPYWAKQYFAADLEAWGVDRFFIQVYAEENFDDEIVYVEASDGISITERQLNRLPELIDNPNIPNILLFPLSGEPERLADKVHELTI